MPESHRGPLMPRLPVTRPRTVEVQGDVTLSAETMQALATLWRTDLEPLYQLMTPWYVRLWRWIRG